MTDNHPTPPPELVEQWYRDSPEDDEQCYIADQAARWGADQELEACVEWLQDPDLNVDTYKLRAARRPAPSSLKEQALEELEKWREVIGATPLDNIRRALEQLDD